MITIRSSAHVFGLTLLGASLVGAGACGDNRDAPAPDATPVVVSDAGFPAVTPIPLATPDGSFYTAMVNVGTQTFAMDLDTGSTTTGVAEAACTTCTDITPLYTPGASSANDQQSANTQYGDGSTWSGNIYTDLVGLGNGSPNVKVSFVAITTQSEFFDDNDDLYQGILGLGPEDLLEPGTTAYMTAAKAVGATTAMSFELCDDHGNMWIGDYPAAYADRPAQTTPMVPIQGQQGFYAVEVDDMGLGSASFGFGSATFEDPIVDTGTSLFYVPSAVLTALIAGVNAAPGTATLFGTAQLAAGGGGGMGGGGHRCLTATGITADMVDAALPPLTVTMPDGNGGKTVLSIPATQSYLEDDGNGRFCLDVFNGGSTGLGSIMGDAFLRAFVTTIDVPNGTIGFAPDAGCAASAGSTGSGSGSSGPTSGVVSKVREPRVEHGHPHFRPAGYSRP